MLSVADLAARAMTLPGPQRAIVAAALEAKYGHLAADRGADRRRAYFGRPHAFIRDALGYLIPPDGERIIDTVMEEPRSAFAGGTGLLKSHFLSALALYFFSIVGSMPDPMGTREQQGCRIILLGPAHPSVFGAYQRVVAHRAVGEARGFPFPGRAPSPGAKRSAAGEPSIDSVLWRIAIGWEIEAFSPPKKSADKEPVTHAVSGRHEGIMFAHVEEAQGVLDGPLNALESMLGADGQKIVLSFNPVVAAGAAYQRAVQGYRGYKALFISAMTHPNVLERRQVIVGATSHATIDQRVETETDNVGAYPSVLPDPDKGDMLYALPPAGAEDPAPRTDGVPGHRDGEVRVRRPARGAPGMLFQSQVLGVFPRESSKGLFAPGAWDEGVARWRAGRQPESLPCTIGLDCARSEREEADDSVAFPRWGEDGPTLLRAWAEAQHAEEAKRPELLAALQARRIRSGEAFVSPKGDGEVVCRALIGKGWLGVPWNVDAGGVGAAVLDIGRHTYGGDLREVSFGAAPPEPVPGMVRCVDVRTAMYVTAEMLVARGLADPPPDPQLREEVMAHALEWDERSVEVEIQHVKIRKRVPIVRLVAKDEVKKIIGRSPDRSDGWVLSLWQQARRLVVTESAAMPF